MNSDIEIPKNQQPDSIWTWKSNKRSAKVSLWLPYFQGVEKVRGSEYRFAWNSGEVVVDLRRLDCIMIYGASGMLDIAFLDALRTCRVPLLIHRRNMNEPAVFMPSLRPDPDDILTQQILLRTNQIKAAYIARTLVRERFRAVQQSLRINDTGWRKLARMRQVSDIRLLEAEWARRYWRRYFASLGIPHQTRRDKKAPVPVALDACSFFLYGVILRWVLVHRMSPSHGYLHVGTNYSGLVYDLMEPYRYLIEHAVAKAVKNLGVEADNLTGMALSNIKYLLDQWVHIPMTRQQVRRKNLLHGVVLALRAYLAGDMKRFVVPAEGERQGGRPPKISWRVPGGR